MNSNLSEELPTHFKLLTIAPPEHLSNGKPKYLTFTPCQDTYIVDTVTCLLFLNK